MRVIHRGKGLTHLGLGSVWQLANGYQTCPTYHVLCPIYYVLCPLYHVISPLSHHTFVKSDHLSKVIKSAGEGPLSYGFEQALLLKGFENSSHKFF